MVGLLREVQVKTELYTSLLGTAQELYNAPANRFVASFLGSPSINLIEDEAGIQLGLRPERLKLQPAERPVATGWRARPGRVVHWEWLGDRVLLHLNSADGPLKVMRPSSDSLAAALQPGAPVEVQWSRVDALNFDARSGERIRPS